MIDFWFELMITIYFGLYLLMYGRQLVLMCGDDDVPELSDEMRVKLYS